MSRTGLICTFYSYKGGVGRSMALANVAELLYRRGLNVRMVDFDLEAPGLERYFDVPDAATRVQNILASRGVIDMLESYRHFADVSRASGPAVEAPSSTADAKRIDHLPVEPLPSFVVPIYEGNNTLSLIPAGRRDKQQFKEYSRRVLTFDWDDFFVNFEGELFFEWFRREVAKDVDVVLIDSRTGVTEMSGVCTYHLPDVVVSFVATNHQNMDGVVRMAASLASRDLITNGRNGRELSQVFVPSRVANDDEAKVEAFKNNFDRELGPFFPEKLKFNLSTFIDLKLPYVPSFAYEERVAGREQIKATEADLLKAYETLAQRISRLAPVTSSYYSAYVSQAERLSHTAEELYTRIDEPQQRLFQQLFTRLVRVGTRGERPVAVHVRLSSRDAQPFASTIEESVKMGLVSQEADSRGVLVSLADEGLIKRWSKLNEWVQRDQAFLAWRQRVCETLADWEDKPIPGNLLTTTLLQEAAIYLPARSGDLTPSEIEFIERSRSTSSVPQERTGTPIQGGNNVDDMLRYTWGEYRAWAITSRVLKTRITFWSKLVLIFTLAGTALGTLSGSINHVLPLGFGAITPWFAAITLGLATYFTSQLLSDSERQAWVKARALAEGLKSESYKYVTGAPPYDVSNAAQVLGEKVTELQRVMGGVIAEPISEEERAKNMPATAWTIGEYVEKRVREQIDGFYRPAIIRHRKAVTQARVITLVFGAAAVALSVLGSSTDLVITIGSKQLVLGALFAAALGTITTAAGAIAAWFQSGHHQQLIQGYQAAVGRLELLLAQRATSSTAAKQFVADAEAVFQAEHATWLTDWQVQPAASTGSAPTQPATTPATSPSA